jgi:hypothetical protein
VIFCCAVTSNYLPHARALAESLAEHHADPLELFVIDEPDAPFARPEPFRRVHLSEEELSREELNRRKAIYNPQALVCSLKARLLASVLARTGGPVVILDADMLVMGPLDDIGDLAATHGIVLTPHASVEMPFQRGGNGPEQVFIRAGVFNAGCIGVSLGASEFLRWLDERCARDCIVALERGIMLEQAWLSLVPALFDHHVSRDRGVNLSGHGMNGQDLDWRDHRPWIGHTAVRLFHFCGGFDPHSDELTGAELRPWWPRTAGRPGLTRIIREYAECLLLAGYDSRPPAPEHGLDWAMRAAYRKALIAAEADNETEPPNPFSHGFEAFTTWLLSPAWPGSSVSHYVSAVHAERADLRAAFPDIPGRDEPALMRWVANKYGHDRPSGVPDRIITE